MSSSVQIKPPQPFRDRRPESGIPAFFVQNHLQVFIFLSLLSMPCASPLKNGLHRNSLISRAEDDQLVGTLQEFRNDGSAQMAAGATHTDFHVNLRYFSNEQIKFPATFPVI